MLPLFLLIAQMAGAADSVPVHVISGEPTCAECRIERYLLATLNDDSLPVPLGTFTRVTVTSDGQFLITRPGTVTPFVADSRGRVVRQVGRSGGGPGEYGLPWYAFETDSFYGIVDRRLRRISYLSKDFEFVRSHRLPPGEIMGPPVPFLDGSYAINAFVPTRGAMGHPVHIVRDESILRSFGGGSRAIALSDMREVTRIIEPARDSSLWVANRFAYRIERWDTAGRLLAVYVRQADWVPSSGARSGTRFRLIQVHEDDEGRLWVRAGLFGDMHTTVVEVLDLERPQVVASARNAEWNANAAYGGFYCEAYQELPNGLPRIDIWGFRLVR